MVVFFYECLHDFNFNHSPRPPDLYSVHGNNYSHNQHAMRLSCLNPTSINHQSTHLLTTHQLHQISSGIHIKHHNGFVVLLTQCNGR